jgi:hypothetical protein
MLPILMLGLLLLSCTSVVADGNTENEARPLRIASWKPGYLGGEPERNWEDTAKVVEGYDLVMMQNIANKNAAEQLKYILNKGAKGDWDVIVSEKPVAVLPEVSYSAFFFKASRFYLEGGETIYKDTERLFKSHPFSARFGSIDGKHLLTLVNVDVASLVNNNELKKLEIQSLEVLVDWVREYIANLTPIIVGGYFEVNTNKVVYDNFKKIMNPLIKGGATRIEKVRGRVWDLQANLWEEKSSGLDITSSYIDNVMKREGWSHEYVRSKVAIQFPVVIELGNKPYRKSQYMATRNDEIKNIFIKCIRPDPEGDDLLNLEHEWVLLKNNRHKMTINLEGWQLRNESGDVFRLSGKIPYGQTYKVRSSELGKEVWDQKSGLAILYDPVDREQFRLGYTADGEGTCQI